MAFKPRLSAPSKTNKFYHKLNPFYQAGYGLPNCTCHAWGRRYEASGKKPTLSLSNAENWWAHDDGYPRGKSPKAGAVICWRKGKAGNSSDGAGHVAYVEEVYSNGDILTSNSAWGGARFYTQYLTKASGYSIGGSFVFQGFIYDPNIKNVAVSAPAYKAGKEYTLRANMKVRKGAGTNYKQKKRSELTADGKKHALNQTYAVLKAGTVVTCLKVVKKGKDIWLKIPSGWVCAKQGGTTYIK